MLSKQLAAAAAAELRTQIPREYNHNTSYSKLTQKYGQIYIRCLLSESLIFVLISSFSLRRQILKLKIQYPM